VQSSPGLLPVSCLSSCPSLLFLLAQSAPALVYVQSQHCIGSVHALPEALTASWASGPILPSATTSGPHVGVLRLLCCNRIARTGTAGLAPRTDGPQGSRPGTAVSTSLGGDFLDLDRNGHHPGRTGGPLTLRGRGGVAAMAGRRRRLSPRDAHQRRSHRLEAYLVQSRRRPLSAN